MKVWEKSVLERANAKGFIVYQAHPFREGIRRCNPDYINGVEVYNGKSTREQNNKAFEWAKKNNKLMISGSDFHTLKNLAKGGIITDRRIENNTQLIDVLKAMDFRMIEEY